MRPLDLRVAAARPVDRPLPRAVTHDGLVEVGGTPGHALRHSGYLLPPRTARYAAEGDLAALTARAASWAADDPSAPRADVELSVRVLAHGGSITVARQVVNGRVVHLEAVVR